MMRGGKTLLLLAVLLLLGRSQQKPQVSKLPEMTPTFSGELLYLKCEDNASGTPRWLLNGSSIGEATRYKIAVAKQRDSGIYECDVNGVRSEPFALEVLDHEPSALLTIKTGQPVMQTGGAVILNLQHEPGLMGWECFVQRGDTQKKIKLKIKQNERSLNFQPKRLNEPETMFWCHDAKKNIRSNQVTVKTSEKEVSLEMYPMPAVAGESLSLRCLTWGTQLLKSAVFYKDNQSISESSKDIFDIPIVTEADAGRYMCHAKFTYIANPTGPPYELDSDAQDVLVQERSSDYKAVLTPSMTCSCEKCPSEAHSSWYTKSSQSWEYVGNWFPEQNGTYACRRVWSEGQSFMSNARPYASAPDNPKLILLVVITLLLLLVVLAVGIFIWCKKRSATGAIYEDVALRARDKFEDKGEPEYDTLDPEAPRRKKGEKEGEYEALKTEEMKGSEYQTLGMEHQAGEGGYQALNKEGMKGGVYHTLGAEASAGGEGGYQALNKEGMKGGVYHTLGAEASAGGEGGYQALNKEGMKGGVYHTLGAEASAGGEDTKQ